MRARITSRLALVLVSLATAQSAASEDAHTVSFQTGTSGWQPCLNPWIIDGDSIRCSNLGEIRLLGIDAPDFTFSAPCRGHYGNHVCDNAADRAATRNLIRLKLRMR